MAKTKKLSDPLYPALALPWHQEASNSSAHYRNIQADRTSKCTIRHARMLADEWWWQGFVNLTDVNTCTEIDPNQQSFFFLRLWWVALIRQTKCLRIRNHKEGKKIRESKGSAKEPFIHSKRQVSTSIVLYACVPNVQINLQEFPKKKKAAWRLIDARIFSFFFLYLYLYTYTY